MWLVTLQWFVTLQWTCAGAVFADFTRKRTSAVAGIHSIRYGSFCRYRPGSRARLGRIDGFWRSARKASGTHGRLGCFGVRLRRRVVLLARIVTGAAAMGRKRSTSSGWLRQRD